MGYSNSKISAPVSIYDVQRALGTNECDLGSLCKHNSINKWARYKPERNSRVSYLPHGTLIDQLNTRKGHRFGLELPFCDGVMNTLVYNIMEFIPDNPSIPDANRWTYRKPRGSSVSPNEVYRLTDFAHLPSSMDDTDPTPSSLTGYNHAAPMPFEVSANADLTTHEVNKQVIGVLEFTFKNSGGDDLHLQDFVDLVNAESDVNAWRPVLQVFKNSGSTEDWYLQSQPYIEIAGQAITSVAGATFKVSLNISDTSKFPFPSNSDLTADTYYLCLGVGYCRSTNPSNPAQPPSNQSTTIQWGKATDNLFVIPYDEERLSDGIYPFFYEFKVAKYQRRRLNVTAISYYARGLETWVTATRDVNEFTIHSLATGALRLTLTITELPNQSLSFISSGGSWSGTDSYLVIQAREMISYRETVYYLAPKTSGWQTPSTNPVIPRGNESDTYTIYATVNIGNIPVGDYGEYHLFADTGAGVMNDIGYFSIHKVQYTG